MIIIHRKFMMHSWVIINTYILITWFLRLTMDVQWPSQPHALCCVDTLCKKATPEMGMSFSTNLGNVRLYLMTIHNGFPCQASLSWVHKNKKHVIPLGYTLHDLFPLHTHYSLLGILQNNIVNIFLCLEHMHWLFLRSECM